MNCNGSNPHFPSWLNDSTTNSLPYHPKADHQHNFTEKRKSLLVKCGIVFLCTAVALLGVYAWSEQEATLTDPEPRRPKVTKRDETPMEKLDRRKKHEVAMRILVDSLYDLKNFVREDDMDEVERNRFISIIGGTKDAIVEALSEKTIPPAAEESNYGRETVQTCFLQRDESEICVYTNLCFDGQNLVALMDDKETRAHRNVKDGPVTIPLGESENCFDERFNEPSSAEYSQCDSRSLFDRQYPYSFEARDPSIDHPLLLGRKRMGPNGAGFRWRKTHPDNVFGILGKKKKGKQIIPPTCNVPFRTTKNSGNIGGKVIDSGFPGCADKRGFSIEWIPGSIWWVYLEKGYLKDSIQFSSKILPLFDAMRSNRTRKGARAPNPYDVKLGPGSYIWPQYENSSTRSQFRHGIQEERFDCDEEPEYSRDVPYRYSNRDKIRLLKAATSRKRRREKSSEETGMIASRYHGQRMVQYTDDHTNDPLYQLNSRYGQVVVGTQWSMPPLDYVAIMGDGVKLQTGAYIQETSGLSQWNQGMLHLSTRDYTQTLFPPDFDRYGNSRLMCSDKAAVVGKKYSFFTGKADAWMFREYAYKFAGSKSFSHPEHPPKKITILNTQGVWHIENHDEVMQTIKKLGFAVRVVTNVAEDDFKEVIRQMSETGILIVPYGNNMIYSMFLPQHSVIVELFPYKRRSTTYSRMANLFGLYYLSVAQTIKPKQTEDRKSPLYQQQFVNHCEKANRSSIDTPVVPICRAATESSNITVPLAKLQHALDQARAFSAGPFADMDLKESQDHSKPQKWRNIVSSTMLKLQGKAILHDPVAKS